MTSNTSGRGPIARSGAGSNSRKTKWTTVAVLFGPFAVLFAAVYVAPVCYALYTSLFKEKGGGLGYSAPTRVFVGLANYASALSNAQFTESLLRAAGFMAAIVIVLTVVPTVLALVLDSTVIRFRRLFRTALFLPYAVPGVIGGMLWAFLYVPGISPIVKLLHTAGWSVNFLSQGNVFWSVVNVVVWEYTGYNTLIIFAGLLSVPPELVESARIDGASGFEIALRVKVPLVRQAIAVAAVFSVIGSLQLFAEPYVLQTIAPAISSSYTPNLSVFSEAFIFNNYDLAAAESVIIAVVAFVFSFVLMRATRLGKQELL